MVLPPLVSELIIGSHRKNLLISFAGIGSVACMLFAVVGRGGALWAGLLAIIGNVCPFVRVRLILGCVWGECGLFECIPTSNGTEPC